VAPGNGLRLDRINSRELFRLARLIYFRHLETSPIHFEPLGIVVVADGDPARGVQGRVVFDAPVLLPDEQFVPLEMLRLRGPARGRSGRAPSPRPIV
jgi:hypothetical protein